MRAHLLLCMLAYHVEFEMRRKLAPLLFDDEVDKQLTVTPAKKSRSACHKSVTRRNAQGEPVHSFQTLMKELATVGRNRVQPLKMKSAEYWMITKPTAYQQKAFDLLGVKVNIL